MIEQVVLDLGEHSYTITIGAGVLRDSELIRSAISGNSVFVVSNETVAPLYLEHLLGQFAKFRTGVCILPDGEAFKTLESYERVMRSLLAERFNRSVTLVALGGGVVGDLTGFVAATYQRGVNFVQVPTTLLSQVDSSVGGKTAVNHDLGKNMIGAFHQPCAVIIDTQTLSTLPQRELSAGLAEVIKHGVLADESYFDWVDQHMEALLQTDGDALAQCVRRSCEIKAKIVSEDEKETGRRALLNLGHTFGHGIEQAMGFGRWLHGEAVGAGLIMAADLSWRLGRIAHSDVQRIKHVVKRAGLPVAPPAEISVDEFMVAMSVDKKATDQGLRFVLLDGIGESVLVSDVDPGALRETLLAGDRLGETG